MGIIKFSFSVLTTLGGKSFDNYLFLFISRCEYITDYRTLSLSFGRKKTEESGPHSGTHTMFLNLGTVHILSCFGGGHYVDQKIL